MSDKAESSKRASKRAGREKDAIESFLRNHPDRGVHISDGGSNQLTGDLENTPSTEESQKSNKKRGPTRCINLAMESGKRVEVNFNERGQPIERGSVMLSSYLGVISRGIIRVSYDDWRYVPQQEKDDIWELITQKFIIDEVQGKTYVFQLMGKLLRAYKSRLMANVEACKDEEEVRNLMPDNLSEMEWKNFISARSTPTMKDKRAKFKDMRSKQVLPHTCSRKGYARLENEMRKESSTPSSLSRVDVWTQGHTKKNGEPANLAVAEHFQKLQEIRQSSSMPSSISLKDDALSKLLGPERRGRVRGVGSGVTPSKIGAFTQNTGKVARLEHELSFLKEEMQDLKKLVEKLVNNKGHQGEEEIVEVSQTPRVIPLDGTSTHLISTQPSKLQGVKCKLFMMVKENVVAEGRWVTDDPNTLVHHVRLGLGASKVWIDDATEPTTMLWRKTSDMKRMEDALGSTIAWPTDQIIKEDIA